VLRPRRRASVRPAALRRLLCSTRCSAAA
jgi:hypothetical protein